MHEWIEQRDADRLKITLNNTRWAVVESYDHPQLKELNKKKKKKENQGNPREDF